MSQTQMLDPRHRAVTRPVSLEFIVMTANAILRLKLSTLGTV